MYVTKIHERSLDRIIDIEIDQIFPVSNYKYVEVTITNGKTDYIMFPLLAIGVTKKGSAFPFGSVIDTDRMIESYLNFESAIFADDGFIYTSLTDRFASVVEFLNEVQNYIKQLEERNLKINPRFLRAALKITPRSGELRSV